MNFFSEAYSFAANDGRIVLRACIDRPSNSTSMAFEYLNAYSNSIHCFVKGNLLFKALQAYDASESERTRFWPLLYTLKYHVTYSDEDYLSCVVLAKLTHSVNTVSQTLDTVVFVKEQIIPPRYIDHNHKKKNLALDAEGFPCVAELPDGKLSLRRVGKKRFIK